MSTPPPSLPPDHHGEDLTPQQVPSHDRHAVPKKKIDPSRARMAGVMMLVAAGVGTVSRSLSLLVIVAAGLILMVKPKAGQ